MLAGRPSNLLWWPPPFKGDNPLAAKQISLRLAEIPFVLVHFDDVATSIVNANHRIM